MTQKTDQAVSQDGARAVLNKVADALDHQTVSLGDIARHLGQASFTPLLLIPAFTVLSPLSGVPGLSSICGAIIALISLQLLLGRTHLWLPQWLLQRRISARKARNALNWLHVPADWLDRMTRQRLRFFVTSPGNLFPTIVCFFSGAAMPLLELVPFTSSILGGVVVLIAVGFQVRDGLFALAGMAIHLTVVAVLLTLIF